MTALIVISGCSGGGKSALVDLLARRGHAVVREPGRRVIAVGGPLPSLDMAGFARDAADLAMTDWHAAPRDGGMTFFDRGVIDAATAIDYCGGGDAVATLGAAYRYHPTVFLAPPWPAIYVVDAERRHGLADAVAEYRRLVVAYRSLGYDIAVLPRIDVEARAAWLLGRLSAGAKDRARLPPGPTRG